MLHSSSSHYYACYYALLCLLYHQQQALAATYVIDGATTNEWATKDEYQRLVEPGRGPLAAAAAGPGISGGVATSSAGGRQQLHPKQQQQHHHKQQQQQQQQHQQHATKLSDEGLNTDSNGDEQLQQQQQQLSIDQIFRSINNNNNGNKNVDNFRFEAPTSPRVSQRVNGIQDDRLGQDELRILANDAAQRLVQTDGDDEAAPLSSSTSSSSSPNGHANHNQGNSFRNPTGSQQQPIIMSDLQSPAFLLNDRDELKQALDRLDLIERERKLQLKQMTQLDSLEKQAEAGVALALRHVGAGGGGEVAGGSGGGGGARTLSELVPQTDSDFGTEAEADSGPLRRETARHYCGDDLVQIIEMVCEHRVASTDSQPQVIDPVVKTKRSADYSLSSSLFADDNQDAIGQAAAAAAAYDADDNSVAPHVSRRRKLRTLQTRSNPYEGDGEPEQRSSARAAASPSASSSSLSTSTSSIPVHDGTIGINNHNHNHNYQVKRYLSKPTHLDGNNNNHVSDRRDNNDNTNNLNVMRMRQTRRVKSRRVRGITQECCVNACTSETLKQYCELKP